MHHASCTQLCLFYHTANRDNILTGGALVGVIVGVVVIVVTGTVAIVIGAGFFMHWLWRDYFALKPQSKDRKASWMEPDLGDFSAANWGKVKKMRLSFYHSARGSFSPRKK